MTPNKANLMEKSLDYCLKDFQSDDESLKEGNYSLEKPVEIDKGIAPLPYMVFITLVALKGFGYWGKGEKVFWEIPIKYKSFSFLLSHRKFGFRVHYKGEEPSKVVVQEMLRQLNKAIRVVDKFMQPFATEQIRLGNVTLANRYVQLDSRYQFFRLKAQKSFANSKKPAQAKPTVSGIAKLLNRQISAERAGAFYTIAMLDAYFSKLEHLLVLVIPFLEFDCTKDNLIELISSSWSDKYKRIFNLTADRQAKKIYDNLTAVKEKYRNVFNHGDFEKGGASLFFHMPGFSAVPVRLSGFRDSIHYSFFPVTMDSYKDICAILDEADNFLAKGKTKYGVGFANSGLDVAFDKTSLQKYASVTKNNDDFKQFIEYSSYETDRHINMDF